MCVDCNKAFILTQDEYRDTQTLKKRLQALAIAMGLRAQQQKQKTEDGAVNATLANIPPDVSSYQGQNSDNGSATGSSVIHGIVEGPSAAHLNTVSTISTNAAIVPEECEYPVLSKRLCKN